MLPKNLVDFKVNLSEGEYLRHNLRRHAFCTVLIYGL